MGRAIDYNVNRDCKTIVGGNNSNTNCLVCCHYAPSLSKYSFSALSRLDHNRAIAAFAIKTDSCFKDISHMAVWGNHSETCFPDVRYALI